MFAGRQKGVLYEGCHVFVIPASWPELFEYISPAKGQAPKGKSAGMDMHKFIL